MSDQIDAGLEYEAVIYGTAGDTNISAVYYNGRRLKLREAKVDSLRRRMTLILTDEGRDRELPVLYGTGALRENQSFLGMIVTEPEYEATVSLRWPVTTDGREYLLSLKMCNRCVGQHGDRQLYQCLLCERAMCSAQVASTQRAWRDPEHARAEVAHFFPLPCPHTSQNGSDAVVRVTYLMVFLQMWKAAKALEHMGGRAVDVAAVFEEFVGHARRELPAGLFTDEAVERARRVAATAASPEFDWAYGRDVIPPSAALAEEVSRLRNATALVTREDEPPPAERVRFMRIVGMEERPDGSLIKTPEPAPRAAPKRTATSGEIDL